MVMAWHDCWNAARRRFGRGSAQLGATVLVLELGATRSGAAPVCGSDCDGDGEVGVYELIRLVNISLGDAPLSSCASGDVNGDGEVRIDEILAALVQALYGCNAQQPCTADSCRACGAADTRCASGPAGFYCCTLSGSLFAQLDGASGCESSGIYPNGCWSAADTCHDDAICLIGSTPAPSATATLTGSPTATASGVPSVTATPAATGVATATPTERLADAADQLLRSVDHLRRYGLPERLVRLHDLRRPGLLHRRLPDRA